MAKLYDTLLMILNVATQREDRNVLSLPGSLRVGAATKVVAALFSRGLIADQCVHCAPRPRSSAAYGDASDWRRRPSRRRLPAFPAPTGS